MYYGSIYLTKLQSHEILNLLLSSDELGFQPLVTYIQDTLIEKHYDFIIENIIETIELTYQKRLLISYGNIVFNNPDYCLFKSIKFLSFNPAIFRNNFKTRQF